MALEPASAGSRPRPPGVLDTLGHLAGRAALCGVFFVVAETLKPSIRRTVPDNDPRTGRRPHDQDPWAGPGQGSGSLWPGTQGDAPVETGSAARVLNAAAAALSFSVFADSALEHYRGGFYNRAMYVGPTVAALTLLASASATAGPRSSGIRTAIFATASGSGLLGTGFHTYNVLKREGGLSWENLFHAAPVAAPLGITFAGIFGIAASSLGREHRRCRLLGLPAGELLATLSAVGLLGTAAEAGLLHFRGAFHDPFMYIPVVIPPLAALALGAAASRPTAARRSTARALLRGTAAAGILGMGFHAYGIQRNMGGWANWSQNILQGPPLPAPPSFTGMALAGLAALSLLEGEAGA